MPAQRYVAANNWGRRRKATREGTRGIGSRRGPQVLWGLYERGTVKLHFWVIHFHPFFCSNLGSPFFRPDPGVFGSATRKVCQGRRNSAPPNGLVLD